MKWHKSKPRQHFGRVAIRVMKEKASQGQLRTYKAVRLRTSPLCQQICHAAACQQAVKTDQGKAAFVQSGQETA